METKLLMNKTAFFLVACLVVFNTCKKDQKLAPVIEKIPSKDYMEYSNEGLVGAGGGKIAIESVTPLRGTTVTIPAGALSADSKIKIQADNTIRPIGDSISYILKLEPDGLIFAKPVSVKIPVSKTMLYPVLYYFAPDSMVLEQVPILEYNQSEGYVVAEIGHFSQYLVKDNASLFFEASLYKTSSTIKAKVKFGGQYGLSSVPVKLLNVLTSGGKILSARNMIDYGITATINGTFPEKVYGNIKVDLLVGTWLGKKTLKSVEVAIQRKGKDPATESWVIVKMINPESKDLYTSGIIDPQSKENYFSGNALVFDFNTPAETGKEYYLEMSWCISDNPWGWFINRFTNLYTVNTYRDYPAWTASNMINSDPDKNKNFVDDQFEVVPSQIPTITTTSAASISTTTATSGGSISSDGGATVTAKGVCWSTAANPTIANAKTIDGTGTANYSSGITGLTPNTTYYYRAYATNSVGTAYGSNLSFTTSSIQVQIPEVKSTAATSVTTSTAISGGTISSDGGASIIAKGVCWSTSQNPTTSGSKTSDGTGPGSFSSSITGLSPNTTYYIRAYATNSAGTGYGSNLSITTGTIQAQIPTLTTIAASSITTNSATSGGNISSDGGAAVTAKGVCWGTSSNPTTSNSKTSDGTGSASFSSAVSGLTSNTTYYIRAYAINSAGTAYGNILSFTTSSIQAQIPTLTTAAATSITSVSATSGGNITSEGGGAVTARGVCWSTSSNPTTSNSKTTDGSGAGIFSSTITGLSSNTAYHVRAYATNSAGTSYGNDITFNTNSSSGSTNTDADGNTYTTVTIGTQVWMASNLKTTKYNDGTAIPLVTDGSAWANLSTPGYCWYNNDAATNKNTYGALYNWYTVNTGKLCPAGWHVPTDAEWRILTTYLGGTLAAGGKLKESGTSHWLSPNMGATNTSGFTALPGGFRNEIFGGFYNEGSGGHWWSSSAGDWYLSSNNANANNGSLGYLVGLSVRCLHD